MLFKCYTYTLLFRYVPPGFGNKDYIESFIVLIWRPLNENDCMPYCLDFVHDILSVLPDLIALFIYYYLL